MIIGKLSRQSTKNSKIEEDDVLSSDTISKQSTKNSKIEEDGVLSIDKLSKQSKKIVR